MLPNDVWSSTPVEGEITYPRNSTKSATTASDYGPVAIQDTSEGLAYKVWTAVYDSSTGRIAMSTGEVIFYEANITSFDMTFNQTANPFIAYEVNGYIKIYWYDPLLSAYTRKTITSGEQPFCFLDERRSPFSSKGDIILLYYKNSELFYRYQRDRFQTEYSTGITGTGIVIDNFGMGVNNRLTIKYYQIT